MVTTTTPSRRARRPIAAASLVGLGLACSGFGLTLTTGAAHAGPDDVCPGEHVQVGDEQTSVTVTAPDGMLIDSYCVKAGSAQQGDGPEIIDVDPDAKSVTFSHSSGKAISHYSVTYIDEPVTTTPPSSEPPSSEPPSSEPPSSEPPSSEPPSTEPPSSQPPSTEPTPSEPEPTHPASAPPAPPEPPEAPAAPVPTRVDAGLTSAPPATGSTESATSTALGRGLIGLGIGLIGAGALLGITRIRSARHG